MNYFLYGLPTGLTLKMKIIYITNLKKCTAFIFKYLQKIILKQFLCTFLKKKKKKKIQGESKGLMNLSGSMNFCSRLTL